MSQTHARLRYRWSDDPNDPGRLALNDRTAQKLIQSIRVSGWAFIPRCILNQINLNCLHLPICAKMREKFIETIV